MKNDKLTEEEAQDLLRGITNMCIMLNKRKLEKKEHIKKYKKIRRLHNEISQSMIDYILSGKYNLDEHIDEIYENLQYELKNKQELRIEFDFSNDDDIRIINELFSYKTHKNLTSVTEIYLNKKILRNEEKVKILNAMKNSYVGLFKITKTDREEGYIYLEDVFTKRKIKIIDTSMSSIPKTTNDDTYIYDRIITVDDISFGTYISGSISPQNKYLKEYIKKHKYNNHSDFIRCLDLYEISKKETKIKTHLNTEY